MTTQLEALRLAECLDEPLYATHKQMTESADELRRLHASCEDYAQHKQRQDQRVLELKAQRDALLEALAALVLNIDAGGASLDAMRDARAAIKAVEEGK